jgi:hypothetical protein
METFKEKLFLYAFFLALIITSVFPDLFKTLFVHQSGKFEVIGIGWVLIIIFNFRSIDNIKCWPYLLL